MPIIILFAAILLIAAGLNNKINNLVTLLGEDFVPSDNTIPFGIWLLAIIFIAAIGFVKDLRGIANGFLVLLFLGIILAANKSSGTGGFFAEFSRSFNPPKTNPTDSSNGVLSNFPNLSGSFLNFGSSFTSPQSLSDFMTSIGG